MLHNKRAESANLHSLCILYCELIHGVSNRMKWSKRIAQHVLMAVSLTNAKQYRIRSIQIYVFNHATHIGTYSQKKQQNLHMLC